jgi:hypothetical protein
MIVVLVVVVVDKMEIMAPGRVQGIKQIGHLGDITQWVPDCPAAEWQAEAAIRFTAPQAAQQNLAVAVVQVHKLPMAGMVLTVWVATMAETHSVAELPAVVEVVAVATAEILQEWLVVVVEVVV